MTQQEYNTVHKWVQSKFTKTGVCSNCKTSGLTGHKIHWANMSGQYKRIRKDWIELCAKCHQKFDHNYKKSNPIYIECVNCQKHFRTYPCFQGRLYCSRSCYTEVRNRVKNYQMIGVI